MHFCECLENIHEQESTSEDRFSHNISQCVYRFHDFAFLKMKKVVLTDEKHFNGRTECTVEFYNLPRGTIYVKIGGVASKQLNSGQK